MSLLNELGIKYRTDKGTNSKRGVPGEGHDYLTTYERYLPIDRHDVRRVLEIGVKKGASIRMWQDYFPGARIYGLDIDERALRVEGPRIKIGLVDQSDSAALEAFAQEFGPFDLIVDDGSHVWSHQILSLQTLLKHVGPRGCYIVEDLQTSFSPEFGTPDGPTGIEYVLRCCEKVLGGNRVRTDDPFVRTLSDKVESVITLRKAAMFICR